MRNFKKFLTLALAVLMVVSAFAFSASAAKFTDIDADNAYLVEAVNLLSNVGVVKGTSETEFSPNDLVTREQMSAFIYRLMKKGQWSSGGTNTTSFTDLEDPTFFFSISWASSQGIIKGTSATTFEPKGSITLQDAYTMVVRALGYEKEETLPYPFGFIGVAEQDGVELDEGLRSDVGYEDALTRADVAIILYNAFFAETGVAETYQAERELSDGSYVLETKTKYPTLCEKIFDVVKVEYQAIATPNYVFGTNETTKDLGYEALELVRVDDDADIDAPADIYASAEDLNLVGNLDEYIMSHFTMYVKLDKDDEIESILYAEPLMVKKTVSDIKFETLSSNKAGSYYGNNSKGAKRLSGKVTIDGKVAYFFNAPYSYAKPTYAVNEDDAAKYDDRNEKNLKFIDFEVLGNNYEDGEYNIFLAEVPAFLTGVEAINDEFNAYDSEVLMQQVAFAYVGGLYEADVYDVDGDGLYDYILPKPYVYAFIDTDDDYTFFDDAEDEYALGGNDKEDLTLYVNDAVLEGEKVKDEDFVLAYVNYKANYVKVAKVIAPVESKVASYKANTSMVTLTNGDKVNAAEGWKYIANLFAKAREELVAKNYSVKDVEHKSYNELLKASALDLDKNAKFYVYDGTVLFLEGVDNKVTFDNNLIVVTTDIDNNQVLDSQFNPVTGKKSTYVYAWVDGETKYVPIDTDADVWPKIVNAGEFNYDYLDKIATYTVDGDGLYTIKMLGNAYDDKAMGANDYIGIDWDETVLADDKDDSLQVYGETDITPLAKQSKGIFKAEGIGNYTLKLQDYSIVLIKNVYVDDDEDVVDFIKLGVNNLTETIAQQLTNVQYIIMNDETSTRRENLVVLYGEVIGEELDYEGKTGSKDYRIIKYSNVDTDEDGKYRVFYELYDPYTGNSYIDDSAIASSKSYSTAKAAADAGKLDTGDIAKLKGGLVDDSSREDYITNDEHWYLVYEYIEDGSDSSIGLINYADGVDGEVRYYSIDKATVVTKLGDADHNLDNFAKWGAWSVVSTSKLATTDKSLLASKSDYEGKNGNYTTKYAKYQKAYVKIDTSAKYLEDGMNGYAEFIVILVHDGEAVDYLDVKAD